MTNNEDKRPELHIHVGEFCGLGLILAHPSGVFYSSQTGGYACHHPQLEGAFIPLDETKGFESVLEDHFTGEKWGGHCYKGIDEETADFIDNLLNRSYIAKLLKVDRDRLSDCEEAWIHVIVEREPAESWPSWSRGGRGVLTWNNSD